MIEPYDLLIEAEVTEQVKRLRGRPRQAVKGFILSLAENPFDRSQSSFPDHKGRVVETVTLYRYTLRFHVDHALREVKVLEMLKL
jgi:mRNA-degrading endonuclease RelE of RelBE toxin-antitoxin system